MDMLYVSALTWRGYHLINILELFIDSRVTHLILKIKSKIGIMG